MVAYRRCLDGVVLLTAVLLIGKKRRANRDNATAVQEQELEGPPGDREMSFWEHLAELRSRLVRAIVYWALGSVVGWIYYDTILNLLIRPIEPAMHRYDIPFTIQSIFEPLMLKLQVSIASGLVIAFPLILLYRITHFTT